MLDVLATTRCPDRTTWSSFYTGRVPPDALPELAAHLDGCASCRGVLHALAGATLDEADPLVSVLRAGSPRADEYEVEPACRDAVERARSIVFDSAPGLPPPTQLPEKLGEYRIVRLIGRGGMGSVYRAVHQRLGREVALKVITPERARVGNVERFRRETAAHGKLDHPNVVRATDAGEADGVAYLVMDLVDGIDLDRLVRTCGPLPVAEACELARQAAAGLQHLTAHGLVHRDVKPSNLMLSRGGVVQLLDFGLAAFVEPDRIGAALTDDGQVIGTFDYLAPEQADPVRPVDARTDVYGLGCALYFLLTGAAPYSGPAYATARSKILAHTAGPVLQVRDARPNVPVELAAVVARMMAKYPDDRLPDGAAVADALAPFCAGHDLAKLLASVGFDPPPQAPNVPLPSPNSPRERRSHRLVFAAVLAVLLFGSGLAAAVKFWRLPPEPQPVANADPPKEPAPEPAQPEPPAKIVLPVAVLTFDTRDAGAKDMGAKVTDLLFVKLAAKPDLLLVERTHLKTVLEEQALSLTGAVKTDEAVKVGQLTGAKLLVTGSVVQVDKKLYLLAKVISAETGRVAGASAEGTLTDDLGALAGKLADAIDDTIAKQGEKLVPRPVPVPDRIAGLNKQLAKFPRPTLAVQVSERHQGQPIPEAAAQTELGRFARGVGFDLTDTDKADVVISGTGVSEVVGRAGGLVSARARVELKAVDRKTGKVLALDSQTAVAVDLSESIAGKLALQDAAGQLAERLLPRIVAPDPKK